MKFIPIEYRLLLKRLLLLQFAYFILRFLFIIYNYTYLDKASSNVWMVFLHGIRFDLAAIIYSNALFILLHLFSFGMFHSKIIQHVLFILFLIFNSIFAVLNFVDLAYFPFSHKRSTIDALRIWNMGTDTGNNLTDMIVDFWKAPVLFILFIVLLTIFYPKYKNIQPMRTTWKQVLLHFFSGIVICALCFGVVRGSLTLKPMSIQTASALAGTANAPFVLNTTYTVIRSYGQETIETKNYFSDENCERIAPYTKRVTNGNTFFDRKNIVILILEGIGKEYIGAYTPQNNFTPFLDSLRYHSLEFRNSYANGTMSIEGIPAIVAGIPSWMNNTFISSPYNGNQFESIATVLKKEGYTSAFFHGGNNGTMGFDNFALAAGFDKYYGRTEYGKHDYDGNWGVFDKPYLEYACAQMSKFNKPFCAAIFTLSSHHPYTIPNEYKSFVKKGSQPFLSSVNYVDYALNNFFALAKKTSWYPNTLFIITSDHTSHRTLPYYQTKKGLYEIPIFIFDPKNPTHREVTTCMQQIDIYPTILGYLGYNKNVDAFGTNALLDTTKTVIQYNSGAYQLISKDSLLEFDGENFIGLYQHVSDSFLQQNLITKIVAEGQLQQQLKAQVQQFNNRMIRNKMSERTAR